MAGTRFGRVLNAVIVIHAHTHINTHVHTEAGVDAAVFFNVFIYLAASDLSFGSWALCCSARASLWLWLGLPSAQV